MNLLCYKETLKFYISAAKRIVLDWYTNEVI